MHGRPARSTGGLAIAVLVFAIAAAACGFSQPTPTARPAGASPGSSAGASATALPTPGPGASGTAPTVLLAAGDIGRCDSTNDDATGALVSGIPGAIAILGDTAYEDGTTEDLNNCFGGSWGAVKDRIRFAATGNHDIHTDGGAPLQEYLGSAAAREGRTWFSDSLGAWHVIVLDGNCGPFGGRCGAGSDQERWLRDDLAANTARCTLALIHQPLFSSGQHGADRGVRPLWDALYAGGADLVLNGHDHDYERFAPQNPDGTADPARGIVEIVAGTGGADLEPFRDPAANSLVRLDDTYGVVELTLPADSWSMRFVGTDGSAHDQAAGDCH